MFWWRVACLVVAAATTSAAGQQGAALSKRSLRRLKRLLSRPELAFLGPWAANTSQLQEVHALLKAGDLVVIEEFLKADVARAVQEDTLRGISAGWLRPIGTAIARLGLEPGRHKGRRAGSGSAPACRHGGDRYPVCAGAEEEGPVLAELTTHSLALGERCRMLRVLDDRLGFKFRYHMLDPRKAGDGIKASDFPGHHLLYAGFTSSAWATFLTLLATGSDVLPAGLEFDLPFYREYRPKDYALLHNDVDGGSRHRLLCLNYWFPVLGSLGARNGGDFLWCGASDSTGTFPAARALPPSFNAGLVFLPSLESWHAVSAVQERPAGDRFQRLSFTSWLSAERPGHGAAARTEL